jgi:hypothetical protein
MSLVSGVGAKCPTHRVGADGGDSFVIRHTFFFVFEMRSPFSSSIVS